MSEKVYEVPAEWAKRAWVDASPIRGDVRPLDHGSGRFLGRARQAHRLVQALSPRSRTFPSTRTTSRSNGSRTASPTSPTIASIVICPSARNQTAIIWEGDDPARSKHITYGELASHVGHFANVLKWHGVKKGDRVTIYLPMIPEAAYAMLACARIGAIHSIVFGGFSPDALAGRIEDAKSEVVITADEGLRGGRKVPLKANVDIALRRRSAA